ncbi:TonB-dependent receptor plug domain-containing protein [Sphingomonas quercus]|uniref:TonB-dependent receptor n=1 Tax=Sphingomonas quercus TaxID=2842451 RepID=A0ABS6BEQ3_9SPHN|nr:TonB-dependent receptor [Sphingomonas quercus]MBU3076786.1 TonB-dependent receptor [Sphingomonas quercus]
MSSFAHSSRLAIAVAMLTAAGAAGAQQVANAEPQADIIVTGTRTTGMRAADSPAPIQLLGSDMLQRTGQPDLVSSLSQNLPSVQAQAFGTDLQQVNLQMKLRGLSPNHTLILVNGKRRHGTANVSVAGGPFGGSAAPDVSFILSESVDHVEVLQDGAAAQYGTDAIAGVINFIQKKADHGGTINLTGGRYYDQGGKSYTVNGNIGLAPFEGAYLNITAGKTHKGFSFRGNADASVFGNNPTAIRNLANFPLLPKNPYYPYTNRYTGDPELDQTSVMYNAGYEFGDFELYSFGSYGHKKATANEIYRNPSAVTCEVGAVGCTVGANDATNADGTLKLLYPSGFEPQQRFSETDYSFTGGFKGNVGETTFDLASTYGRDRYDVYVQHSANASLYSDTGFSPNTFYIGNLTASQWSNTLDLTHQFDVGFAEPITVAAGLEYRHETYRLGEGDPASRYGSGAQSFFGWGPNDASRNSRNNFSQYLDVTIKPTDKWLIDGAVRHEHYSDFGNTTVFKLTSRYDFSDAIAIRGTVSTGFRAPTLAEEFYNGINVSSDYVGGVFAPNSAAAAGLGFGNLKPEKSTNYSLGLVLHPVERLTITIDAYRIDLRNRIVMSSNFNGFDGPYCPRSLYDASGANPTQSSCLATFDENLYKIHNQQAVYDAMAAALGGQIPPATLYVNGDPALGRSAEGSVFMQTFVNGVTMRTQGVDAVMSYSSNFGGARVDWSLSGNYNANKVRKIYPLPAQLYTSTTTPDLTVLQDRYSVAEMEHSTPRFRATASAFVTLGKLTASLQENFYSSLYTLGTAPSGSPIEGEDVKTRAKAAFITNLELGYQIAEPIKISIGANNLFNKYPTKPPFKEIRQPRLLSGSPSYATNVNTSSAYGYNGGYYYARIGVRF